MAVTRRATVRFRRLAPWAALGISFALSLTAAVLAARVSEARSPGSFDLDRVDLLAALIGLLGVLTSALLFALTRSQLATRRAVRAGAVALEREEALRAHVEQQGLAARREAQERLALIDALFRATPAGLAVFDRQLRCVRLNHGLCDLLGTPAGAHLGRRISQVVPDLAAAEAALVDVLDRGEARTVEISGHTPAFPDMRTLLCNFAPVRNENSEVVGVAAVVFDITERKRAEQEAKALLEALRAEREVAAVLHRVGQQIAAELNLERLAQALADAAARVTNAELAVFAYASSSDGQEAEWALSGPARSAWDGVAPHALLRATEPLSPKGLRLAGLREEVRVANPVFDALRRPPGFQSAIVMPVMRTRGPLTAALVVAHTETNHFSAHDESVLAGLSTQAAIALENARLYTEAEGLIRALARSNRELDQFAYVASHDLKAPLRGIANIANWLEEDMGESLPRAAREHLKLLRSRVVRLENMIGGILRYSRAGRYDPQPESFQVADLVNEVVALLSPPEQVQVRLGELPLLCTARVPLQQVFMNLIGNALKYAGRPDVTVDVEARPVDARCWQFSVRDNGPGIDAEDHERIWQIFQSRARDNESSGIGLAVVRKTVEARGGRAWVESTPGCGATFHFTWPTRDP